MRSLGGQLNDEIVVMEDSESKKEVRCMPQRVQCRGDFVSREMRELLDSGSDNCLEYANTPVTGMIIDSWII